MAESIAPRRTIGISKRPSKLTQWLTTQIQLSGITAAEIAEACGVGRNMISIWKSGTAPVPLKHIYTIAMLMGADPLYARNLYFQDYFPEMWKNDERIRRLSNITNNELEFLEILRSAPVANPKMNEEQKEQFKKFVEGLSGDNGINKNSPDVIEIH